MSTALDPETLITMAYARLKGMRDNVPSTAPAPRALVNDFNRALEDLKAAGYDLSAFQISPDDMVDVAYADGRHAESSLLLSRIDAVLIYFRIDRDPDKEGSVRARIGFQTPTPPTPTQ